MICRISKLVNSYKSSTSKQSTMFKKQIIRIISLFFIFGIMGFTFTDNDSNPFAINFRLLNKTAKLNEQNPNDSPEFCFEIKFINVNHPTIYMTPYIEFGHKGSIPAFYLEAYELNGKEVNLQNMTHPDWFPCLNLRSFAKGDVIIDKICNNHIYKFRNKGTYKLRFVFDPKKYFQHKGEISSKRIYSNWDTLTIN
jgi:hypothetical protein